jgi:hypothetical protein
VENEVPADDQSDPPALNTPAPLNRANSEQVQPTQPIDDVAGGPSAAAPDISDQAEHMGGYDMRVESSGLCARSHVEGFAVEPSIGGVELGKVPILILDNDDDEGIEISFPRKNMKFHSGQIYLPIFKRLTMKTGMKRMRRLGAFAAMVANLMLPQELHEVTAEEKAEIDRIIRELSHVQENIESEIDISEGNNCVRQEFYLSTTFDEEDREWEFPILHPLQYLLVSRQNSYFKAYKGITQEVMKCLCTTILGRNQCNFDYLPPSAKRMIILCAEMSVCVTEFQPFNAKSMLRIKRILRNPRRLQVAALPARVTPRRRSREQDGDGSGRRTRRRLGNAEADTNPLSSDDGKFPMQQSMHNEI